MSVSITHEGLLALFRNEPRLALRLLGLDDHSVASARNVRIDSSDFTEPTASEARADLVLLVHGANGLERVIVIEVQLRIDPEKLYAWSFYAAAARRRHRVPTDVLVITLDPRVAAWAARPIDLDGRNEYRVHVVGPDAVPFVTHPAPREPELAVLSVMAHARSAPTDEAVRMASAALAACRGVDDERGALYLDLIYLSLAKAARVALEKLMPQYEYQSEYARRFVEQGRAEGEALGRAEGEALGEARAVLRILTSRGLVITTAQRDAIYACTDLAQLDRWVERAVTVTSAGELFDDP